MSKNSRSSMCWSEVFVDFGHFEKMIIFWALFSESCHLRATSKIFCPFFTFLSIFEIFRNLKCHRQNLKKWQLFFLTKHISSGENVNNYNVYKLYSIMSRESFIFYELCETTELCQLQYSSIATFTAGICVLVNA